MTAVVRLLPHGCSWCTQYPVRYQYGAGNLIPDFWRTTWTVDELRYRAGLPTRFCRGGPDIGLLYPPPRKGQQTLDLVPPPYRELRASP